jgi:hypothetical protein
MPRRISLQTTTSRLGVIVPNVDACQAHNATEEVRPRSCPAPARRRGSSDGRSLPRPLNIDGPPFTISGRLDLERQHFAELWPAVIPRKARDVNEDRITAACRRDEAKAAVVFSLLERADEAHSLPQRFRSLVHD